MKNSDKDEEVLNLEDDNDFNDSEEADDDDEKEEEEEQQQKPQGKGMTGEKLDNQPYDLAVDVNDSEEIDSEEEEDADEVNMDDVGRKDQGVGATAAPAQMQQQ